MDLPKNEKVFDFDVVGDMTAKKYDGQFTVVCALDLGRRHALEIEKTRLQADFNNPTTGLSGIALILANLRVRIIDAPNWWVQSQGGFKIFDENIIVELYDKVMGAEIEWRKSILEKAKPSETPKAEAEQTQQK